MRIRLLPSSTREPARWHYLTTFVVDDALAIDAGALGSWETPSVQERVRDVFLTHSHADHTAGLPLFLENSFVPGRAGPTVHGHAATIGSLERDLFNDRVWPDLLHRSAEDAPFVKLSPLAEGERRRAGGLEVTPILVAHPVPTFSYLVDDGEAIALFSGDTGPTRRLWEVARALPRLKLVFLELSFPDEQAALAARAGHLTPTTFAAELEQLDRPDVRVVAFHLKARWYEQAAAQLLARRLHNVEIGQCGPEYAT